MTERYVRSSSFAVTTKTKSRKKTEKPLYQSEAWFTTIHMKINLHVNKISFLFEKMGTKTLAFRKRLLSNLEMANLSANVE